MKKSIKIGVKPLAMATAFAAGTTVSMIATALPGGDTLGALAGAVNESVCQQSVDMSIAGDIRTVTTGTGTCQLRSLPPTKGFARTESSPAGGTVVDSSALVNAGGELYEAYVGGERDGVTLLTPNRALATSRAITFSSSATEPSLAFDFAATVQPATGLQPEWLTGSYKLVSRNHAFDTMANGLEHSFNGPEGLYSNPALGERNYTTTMDVTFNGDGTCSIDDVDHHLSGTIKKDPTMDIGFPFPGEQDVDCFSTGGPECSQNDGNNYTLSAVVTMGSTYPGPQEDEIDWMDQQGGGSGSEDGGCTYATSAGKVDVTYTVNYGVLGSSAPGKTWTVSYDVSADLRYLVSDGDSAVDYTTTNSDNGSNGGVIANKGGIQVGVRTGAASFTGNTYLFNAIQGSYASSTPNTASYENPLSPVYQEEECVSRGALTLNADNTCTVTGMVSTCSGRSNSGYEESGYNVGDGTIVDSLEVFEGSSASPACSWSGSASDLTVLVGQLDQEGNPITMTYTGAVSDNGEALAMHGIYHEGMVAPDTDNPPLLNGMKYNMTSLLVAQQYQGDLNANADADAESNLAEFTWSRDVTPTAGSVRNDFDNDGDSDIYFRRTDSGKAIGWLIENNVVGSVADFGFPNVAYTLLAVTDLDGDGDRDVLFRDLSNGKLFSQVIEAGSMQSFAVAGYPNAAYEFRAVADLDADGDSDVLLQDPSTSKYYAAIMTGGTVTAFRVYAYSSSAYGFVGVGDVDADGDDDVIVRDSSNGKTIAYRADNGVATAATVMGFIGTSQIEVGLGDIDADGDADLLWKSAAGKLTGYVVEAGVINSLVTVGYPNNAWTKLAVRDMDGDGDVDLLWRDPSNGKVLTTKITNGVQESLVTTAYTATSWVYKSTGDYDKDGDQDLLYMNSSNAALLQPLDAGVAVANNKIGAVSATYAPSFE